MLHHFEVRSDIGILFFDSGDKINTLGRESVKGFIERCRQFLDDKSLKGLIITSKKDEFIVGGDIDAIYEIKDFSKAVDFAEPLKRIMRELELDSRPVVAAIGGNCLGGGYEVALACNFRVAAGDKNYKIGLPEVQLGLLPGAGGTQRLPRMIGIKESMPFLLEGKKLSPMHALKAGLVDECVVEDQLLSRAEQFVFSHKSIQQPWDRKENAKIYNWPSHQPGSIPLQQVFAIAPAMANKATKGLSAAPQNILRCLYEGAKLPIDMALEFESKMFGELVVSQSSKNIIKGLWYDMHAVKKNDTSLLEKSGSIGKVAVIGAGMMGAGIAYCLAESGIETVLKDIDMQAAEKGKAYSENVCGSLVKKGRRDEIWAKNLLERISPTADYEKIKGADFIIEAVFENKDLKFKIIKDSEPLLAEGGIFGSNTSTLPITSLAEAAKRPEDFIGLHFFSPVDKMQLVEIIKGRQTSAKTLARSIQLVLTMKKIPIVVNDSPGFYTSRVFKTYLMEGFSMLSEGVPPELIESAGVLSGMPVAPLALGDNLNLKLLLDIIDQNSADKSSAKNAGQFHGKEVVVKMVQELKRPGRKAGKGFYEYSQNGEKNLWAGLQDAFPVSKTSHDIEELQARFLTIQSVETMRCLQEGVLDRVCDANIGSIFGWGFPAPLGGTLQYVNSVGLKNFSETIKKLEAKVGSRFNAPDILREKIKDNTLFV